MPQRPSSSVPITAVPLSPIASDTFCTASNPSRTLVVAVRGRELRMDSSPTPRTTCSHEVFETITDPDRTAWRNSLNNGIFGEGIGDECSFLIFTPNAVYFDPSAVTLNGATWRNRNTTTRSAPAQPRRKEGVGR